MVTGRVIVLDVAGVVVLEAISTSTRKTVSVLGAPVSGVVVLLPHAPSARASTATMYARTRVHRPVAPLATDLRLVTGVFCCPGIIAGHGPLSRVRRHASQAPPQGTGCAWTDSVDPCYLLHLVRSLVPMRSRVVGGVYPTG